MRAIKGALVASPQVLLGCGQWRPCCCPQGLPACAGFLSPSLRCYFHRFLPGEVQEVDVTELVSALLPGSYRELLQSLSPVGPVAAGQEAAHASGQGELPARPGEEV